jgi:hypothetical protein
VEYALLIAVLSIAVVGAAWALLPFWGEGLDGLSDDAEEVLGGGPSRGSGDKR